MPVAASVPRREQTQFRVPRPSGPPAPGGREPGPRPTRPRTDGPGSPESIRLRPLPAGSPRRSGRSVRQARRRR